MKHTSCTCIVPCYNEQDGVIHVLKKLTQIKYFDRIIVVNDGSQDKTLERVQDFAKKTGNEKLHIISYPQNQGKAYAVQQGLNAAKTTYICMFDSDLKGVKPKEINYMIENMYKYPEIDMGILRRVRAKRYVKVLYRELILSGQRMLKTQDFRKVFQQPCEKYQLEVAINSFMHKHKKTVVRYPFSGENSKKNQKRGIINGVKKDVDMFRDIFKHQGIRGYIKHSVIFSPINEKKYIPSKKIR